MKSLKIMEDYALKTVASKLQRELTSDGCSLDRLYTELQLIRDESKLWLTNGNEEPPGDDLWSRNQEKITLLENRLGKTCIESIDMINLKWLYHEIHKDVGFYCIKNTTASEQDPNIRTVLDLMTKYEQNCRKKEELENILNKVHYRLIKGMARQSSIENEMGTLVQGIQHTMCSEPNRSARTGNSDGTEPQLSTACGEEHQINGAIQPRLSPKRKPLAALDMNQALERSNCQSSPRKDPLRRIRSPMLCAYLKKTKE